MRTKITIHHDNNRIMEYDGKSYPENSLCILPSGQYVIPNHICGLKNIPYVIPYFKNNDTNVCFKPEIPQLYAVRKNYMVNGSEIFIPCEGDLVAIREECSTGYTTKWVRVKFIDNDYTFIGHLERCERYHGEMGSVNTYNTYDVIDIYQDDYNFCYDDNVTVCDCKGLCRNK